MLPTQYNAYDYSPATRRFNPLGAALSTWTGLLLTLVGGLAFILSVAQIVAMGFYDADLIGSWFNVTYNAKYAYKIMFAFLGLAIFGFVLFTGIGLRAVIAIGVVWLGVHSYGTYYSVNDNGKSMMDIKPLNKLGQRMPVVQAGVNQPRQQQRPAQPRQQPVMLSVNGKTKPMQQRGNKNTPQYWYNHANKSGLVKHKPLDAGGKKWCKAHINDRVRLKVWRMWHKLLN